MQPEDNFYSSSDGPFCLWTASVDGCMEIQLDGIKGIRKQSDRGLLCIWKYIWCRKERHAVYSIPWTAPLFSPLCLRSLQNQPIVSEGVRGFQYLGQLQHWDCRSLSLCHFFPQTQRSCLFSTSFPKLSSTILSVCVNECKCVCSRHGVYPVFAIGRAPYSSINNHCCSGFLWWFRGAYVCVCVLNCTHYNYDLVFFSLCQPF